MPFFEVVVEEQEFAESKSASLTSAGNQNYEDENGFLHVSDDTDDLPFE
jgi:hypothetical protein